MSGLPYQTDSTNGTDLSHSEADGKTNRISTQASEKVKFELRWHELEAKS